MTDLNVAAVLEEMVARQEIGHAIARLQRGLDRSDAALLSSAFHADAAVDYGFLVGSSAAYSTSAISLISRTWSVGEGVCSASGDAPTSKVCKPARRPASTSVGASPTNQEPARSTA